MAQVTSRKSNPEEAAVAAGRSIVVDAKSARVQVSMRGERTERR